MEHLLIAYRIERSPYIADKSAFVRDSGTYERVVSVYRRTGQGSILRRDKVSRYE